MKTSFKGKLMSALGWGVIFVILFTCLVLGMMPAHNKEEQLKETSAESVVHY